MARGKRRPLIYQYGSRGRRLPKKVLEARAGRGGESHPGVQPGIRFDSAVKGLATMRAREVLALARVVLWLFDHYHPLPKEKAPMTMMLSLARIQLPKHYIREKPNQQIINEWAADLKEKGRYFFPPIEVWIPPDGLEEGKTHELIDGRKRFGAAEKAGLDKIPAVPLAFKKPEDAFARQYVANAENGEFLTKLQRNNYIQVMRKVYKLNLVAIAKITKLSKGQVSRIARGVKEPRRTPPPRPGTAFSVRNFLDDLANMVDTFEAQEKTVLSFLKQKYGESLAGKVEEALTDLSKALEEALKAAKAEAGQEA